MLLNDFERWIGETIGDKELASKIAKLNPASGDLKEKIYLAVKDELERLSLE
jgi:hypothetical protein